MTIEMVQDILFDMLCTVDDICLKENLSYTLGGGSLLGAIRHQGFVPWDDDIDICIWHLDYPRFRETMIKYLPEYYRLIEPEDFSPLFFDFVPRIVDMRYLCRKQNAIDDAYQNLLNHPSVDIFLMDYVSNVPAHAFLKGIEKKIIYGLGMGHRSFSPRGKYSLLESVQAVTLSTVGKLFSMSRIYRIWKSSCPGKIRKKKYAMVSNDLPRYLSLQYRSEWFENAVRVPFRGRLLPVPIGYEEKLTLQYGDYKVIPQNREEGYEKHLDPDGE